MTLLASRRPEPEEDDAPTRGVSRHAQRVAHPHPARTPPIQ